MKSPNDHQPNHARPKMRRAIARAVGSDGSASSAFTSGTRYSLIAAMSLLTACSILSPSTKRQTSTDAKTSAAQQGSGTESSAPKETTAPRSPTPPVPGAATPPAVTPTPSGAAPANRSVLTPVDANEPKIFLGTGDVVKRAPPALPTPPGPEEFNLQFESTDIRAIIQTIMGDYMRESFTIDPATAGNATIRFSRPVSRKDLIPILEMLLRQNNQIMIKEEGIYKIMPAAKGIRGSATPQVVTPASTLPNGYSVQVVQLKFVGSADMKRILEPYVVDATVVRSDDIRNLLILSGTQRELKHLLEIVDLFDVDFLRGFSVGLFPMSTDVKALAGDLDRIFGGAAQSPLAGIVRIIPIERMNGLLVVTTQPRYLEEAKRWIERLDKSGGVAGGLRLNVYPVQHGKAEKLAQLLGEVYGNKGSGSTAPTLAPGQRPAQIATPPQRGQPAQPAQPAAQAAAAFTGSGVGVSKDVRIIADNDNNALVILASPSDYETIQGALRQLDVPRRQVKVEVLVAEVTLNDDLKFGIEWFIRARSGVTGALRNDGGTLPTVPTLPGTPGSNPDVRSIVRPTTGLQLIDVVGGDVRALLQALGTDGRSQTLSTPNVTVLDNETAQINVGDQISVDTGTTTGSGGVTQTSRQYISTGVLLDVTPRINAGGRVTLEINQEISAPAPASGGSSNPNISTRKAKTVVNVASGETMVLAGLIQRTNGRSSAGVPLISKIPVLGGLFGTQSFNDRRTELVVLITPVVINNSDDAKAVMDELRKKVPSLESLIPKARIEPRLKMDSQPKILGAKLK
jgi:general secretion pathway protein D